ncbi:carboxymuconolactone decarboxylase family protein [Pseudoalteromonas sp. PB2-1]|uniref:carboxymuconolactone decarboxylase family protein n=1 Tax=Pseudoalteromonas sp. PB2-1 TaxID=2907242 RepID=UPI00386B2EDD|tara:strand:- start:1622 stop:2068 length:447 start_codon:yes stop_codon:yes gene_type:complete
MKRGDYYNLQPALIKHLVEQEQLIKKAVETSFGLTIWELIKLRVSQINQCAFCIAMHTKQAREYGETTNRIIGLSAWQDMPIYTKQERMALKLCEKLTLAQPIDDTFYQSLSDTFSEQGLVALTIAINAINSWNRIVKMFKPDVEFNE